MFYTVLGDLPVGFMILTLYCENSRFIPMVKTSQLRGNTFCVSFFVCFKIVVQPNFFFFSVSKNRAKGRFLPILFGDYRSSVGTVFLCITQCKLYHFW